MKIKAPKVGYYLKLAFNGIIKNPVMTMSSIFVLLSCLVIMGSFYLVIKNVNYNVNKIDGYNKIVLFIDRDASEYEVAEIGEKYGITKTGVAAAWILRHPANMQLIAGTMNPQHLKEICDAASITLSRADWYEIYRAAGHTLP